ncbi:MAG: circadian clock protein KaiC [Fimbriimonas sp.]
MIQAPDLVLPRRTLKKALTGIEGFDEVTSGGLPQGRPSLVCGSAGCGKTLFAMEFLVRGAVEFGEPGVFVAFEETEKDLVENVASLGFDLQDLVDQKLLALDHITVDRSQGEAGEYDLEGLFVRLGFAIDSIGAKRIVLDTLETLFGGLENDAMLRSELQRLFRWLKEKGITAVITAERGDGLLTRQGLEEYVSDCVILLDHRVSDQVSTRRLRIVKYRGSLHGTNEYPFLIDEDGITVMPLTSTSLDHDTLVERVPTGVEELDQMLSGLGLYRGSSVLLSGTSGTGKSSLAAHFAHATCARGERCLYFAFEESPSQIVRNMASIGLDLKKHLDSDHLRIVSARPSHYGLEMHLATMLKEIKRFSPHSVIIDPITTFIAVGSASDSQAMLIRLVDLLKERGITAYFTSLTQGNRELEATEVGMSSLMDTWLFVRAMETDGERNRLLYVLKSRGMAHSNQVREFLITSCGIRLADVYLGPQGVLTGSARMAREEKERSEALACEQQSKKDRILSERRATAIEAQIAALHAELAAEKLELQQSEDERSGVVLEQTASREAMARSRGHLNGPATELP